MTETEPELTLLQQSIVSALTGDQVFTKQQLCQLCGCDVIELKLALNKLEQHHLITINYVAVGPALVSLNDRTPSVLGWVNPK